MATYNGTCGDNATWTLDTDTRVLTISGTGAMTDYSSSSDAPWYSRRVYINNVVIESGVTSIGAYAFSAHNQLTSVTIPDSVTSIGDDAFYNSTALTSITIPDSVTSIGTSAFQSCFALTSVTIPDSVTSIDKNTFRGCTSLTSVTICGDITSIGNYAFYDCNSLASIIFIGTTAPTLNYNSFALSRSSSTPVTATVYTTGWGSDNVFTSSIKGSYTTFNYESVLSGSSGNTTWEFDLRTGVLTISGTGAMTDYSSSSDAPWYNYRSSITSVVIESGVTSIGAYAFQNCIALTSVSFGGITAPTLNNNSFALSTSSSTPVTATVYTTGWGSDSVFTSTVKGDYTTFVYKTFGVTIPVKVSGEWKDSTPYVKVSGEWKEVTTVFVKVNGEWKEVV